MQEQLPLASECWSPTILQPGDTAEGSERAKARMAVDPALRTLGIH